MELVIPPGTPGSQTVIRSEVKISAEMQYTTIRVINIDMDRFIELPSLGIVLIGGDKLV